MFNKACYYIECFVIHVLFGLYFLIDLQLTICRRVIVMTMYNQLFIATIVATIEERFP